ncbi:hypothetical protein [Pelistega suis]|uniref:hypothetical protein n=1 Tax=Pelistega suis TaxID=1631957 RepID=UPI00211C0AA6|nr:hypothetical protein [Pelistega suis]MCQ9329211.1 hypothetical protein [Pelistega suis]
MSKFSQITIDGEIYNLEHLNPFPVTFTQSAKAIDTAKHYSCIFEFSSHCFTRSINSRQGESIHSVPSGLIYNDKKETRLFCTEQYTLSKYLPDILRNLDTHKCFFTSADDKFLTIELITQDKTIQYEIYFSLKKSTQPNTDIHIFINSAYPRTNALKHQKRKPISFFILLHNTLHNKKIRKPI